MDVRAVLRLQCTSYKIRIIVVTCTVQDGLLIDSKKRLQEGDVYHIHLQVYMYEHVYVHLCVFIFIFVIILIFIFLSIRSGAKSREPREL